MNKQKNKLELFLTAILLCSGYLFLLVDWGTTKEPIIHNIISSLIAFTLIIYSIITIHKKLNKQKPKK